MQRWRLQGFVEAVERWVAQDQPSDEIRNRVVLWVVNDLARRPFSAPARRVGGPFPPTVWFVALPYGTGPGRRVVCQYEVRAEDHLPVCHTLTELSEPL